MTTTNDVPFRQKANIYQNEKFFMVLPLSGYRRFLPEDEVFYIDLKPDVAEAALGQALLQALDKSRFIHPHDDPGFFEADRIVAADKRWHQHFMRLYRYKTKRDAYKNMLYCLAERSEGKISITPHESDEKPGYWWDRPADKTVIIPATDDPVLVGAAVKLALSRCS